MAVPEQTPYIEYTANGVTTSFALGFTCNSKQELKVLIDDVDADPNAWSLVSGSVVFSVAPVSNSIIALKRVTKLERTTNYSSVDNSFRPEAINADFDRVWYALQDQSYKLNQYDFDYSYAINTSNQALSDAATAQQIANNAYNLANTTNTETRPILRGGTGATTAVGARTNLNVYSQEEVDALVAAGGAGKVVGIANGGTGASTAALAQTNLNVYDKSAVYTKTETNTAISNAATPVATESIVGIAEIATQAEVNTATDDARFVTPKKLLDGVKNHLNATGSAPMFPCRAWVNFNGTGTVSIRASGNVSSITDNGVGDYTVNLTTAMPDANYVWDGTVQGDAVGFARSAFSNTSDVNTTTSFKVKTGYSSGGSSALQDFPTVSVTVFR